MQWIGCGSPQKEWKKSGKTRKTVEVDILHAVEVLPKFCNLLIPDVVKTFAPNAFNLELDSKF